MLSQFKQHFITPICHSASYIKKSFLFASNQRTLTCFVLKVTGFISFTSILCIFVYWKNILFPLFTHWIHGPVCMPINNYLLKCNLKNLYTNNGILWYIYNFNIEIFNIENFFQLLSNSINLNSMYIYYICQTAI